MAEWKMGTAWKNGKLYEFRRNDIVVMRPWPEMLAWRRTKARGWKPTRRYADEIFSNLHSRELTAHKANFFGPFEDSRDKHFSEAARYFCGAVYKHVLDTIPPREYQLAFQLGNRRRHALALMSRCPGATDLFEANPGLAFALASNWVFHRPAVQQPLRAARGLITKRQVNIQEWLGFPATERVRKILSRIELGALEIRLMARFQRAIQLPEVQNQLAHLPRITKEILQLICDPEARAKLPPRMWHQLGELKTNSQNQFDAYKLWTDLKYQSKQVEESIPAVFSSFKHLRRVHDFVTEKYRRKNFSDNTAFDFSRAPFSGTKEITPICTGEDLLYEGAVMSHCVAICAHQISNDQYYVYRVTAPVRATMAIVRIAGTWELAEIKGANNQDFPEEVGKACFQSLIQHG